MHNLIFPKWHMRYIIVFYMHICVLEAPRRFRYREYFFYE